MLDARLTTDATTFVSCRVHCLCDTQVQACGSMHMQQSCGSAHVGASCASPSLNETTGYGTLSIDGCNVLPLVAATLRALRELLAIHALCGRTPMRCCCRECCRQYRRYLRCRFRRPHNDPERCETASRLEASDTIRRSRIHSKTWNNHSTGR